MERILAKIRHLLTKDAEKKQAVRFFQVVFLVICATGFMIAVLINSWIALAMSFLQLCLMGTSFCFDKGIIKTDKMNLELIPGIIAVLLVLPYIIGFLSTDADTAGENYSNIDWTQIVLTEVLPEPTSTFGYIEEDSEYGFMATLDAVLLEQYDAYIDKCKDSGFDLDIETTVLKYKAYNADGYRLELSYLKASEQLEITLVAPENMEDLLWEDLRVSKLLPEPKSLYGDVVEMDEHITITLGKITQEDLQEYVKSCKEKGFDVDATEKSTSYEAKNKDGYILVCEYKGGNIVTISITEPLYDIKLELTCRGNLLFSKYDVEVFVDDESLGYIDHGATKTFNLKLRAGKYELKICERGNSSVDGTYTFLVAKDQTKKYEFSCSENHISVEKSDTVTTTKSETSKANSNDTKAESSVSEITTAKVTQSSDEIINVNNCSEFKELMKTTSYNYSEEVWKTFAKTYKGRTIEFDGVMQCVENYEDGYTTYSFGIFSDYTGKIVYEPYFFFYTSALNRYGLEDLNIKDLRPYDQVKVHVKAKINYYDEYTLRMNIKLVSIEKL